MQITDFITPVEDLISAFTSKVSGAISTMDFGNKSLLFAELSILAYFDISGASVWGRRIGFTNVERRTSGPQHSVTIFSNDIDVVIAFRGTYNIPNVIEDIDAEKITDGNLPGKVHKGFLDDFDLLWPQIIPLIESGKNVWGTGHSLGGAMAGIAAVRAARREGPNLSGLVTFGQPRIGDSKYIANLETPTIRCVNHLDIVPHVPTVWMGFTHFGKEFYIDGNGCVAEVTIVTRAKNVLASILAIIKHSYDDHNIINYRAGIVRNNQESANVKR